LAARRIDHDGVFAEQACCVFFAHVAMIPRMIKIGRFGVHARWCADMVFDGCPEVIHADRTAVHKTGTDTNVVFAKATCMEIA